MNSNLLFLLGRQSDLAMAEIISVLKLKKIQYQPKRLSRHELIILNADHLGDLRFLLDRLGGVIKIIQLDAEIDLKITREFKDVVTQLLKPDFLMRRYGAKRTRKWNFGISAHTPLLASSDQNKFLRLIHKTGLEIKWPWADKAHSKHNFV